MKKKICLVVPTIRENNFKEFVRQWFDAGLFDHVDLMVMEDNPTATFKFDMDDASIKVYHYSWEDILSTLRIDERLIPRRSDTVRSFGYYMSYVEGYEYVMTLDDDCYPHPDFDGHDLVKYHMNAIDGKSKWFNTLNNVKPRGVPFYNVGKRNDVVLNHGLWTKVLDYDAPTQLVNPAQEKFDYKNSLVPRGSYFPMCGMNLMWKSKITVWMYHLLMGKQTDLNMNNSLTKLQFDRFGDIWCGIIMKKLCDEYGYSVATGTPYIEHQRASDPFVNLMKEANGIAVNEKFWEHVDNFKVDNSISEIAAYALMGKHVAKFKDCQEEFISYFQELGQAMYMWAQLFENKK